MDKILLENLISELVLESIEEITARTGPRTGAMEISPGAVDAITKAALDKKKEIDTGTLAKDAVTKFKVSVPSPISGKPYVVPVWLFYDPKGDSSAYIQPYRGAEGRGRMGINLFYADPAHTRSVVYHELVHFFDKEMELGSNAAAVSNPQRKAYWKRPAEKKAHLHQILTDMAGMAKRLADRVDSGAGPELALSRSMIGKPELLIRHLTNIKPHYRDIILRYQTDKYLEGEDFIKRLYRGTFDITRSMLEPAVEKRLAQVAVQKNM